MVSPVSRYLATCILVAASLLLCTSVAARAQGQSKDPAVGDSLSTGYLTSQKPGSSTAVSLRVTVENYNSSGSLCQILPDSGGEYIDGAQGITALFDKYGNFYFKFQHGSTTRSVQFNYTSPFLLPSPLPPGSPPFGANTGDFITFKASDPYINLQDMQVGNDNCQCLGTGWTLDTFENSNVTWNNQFHRTGSAFHDNRTSYAVVTCMEAETKCTRWEIEPKKTYLDAFGQPVTIACNNTTGQVESVAAVVKVQAARNKQTSTNYGLYELPFKLTLRKK